MAVEMLTVREVAAELRRSPRRVRDWIHSGELRAVNVSAGSVRARFVIAPSALADFLRARSSAPDPGSGREAS